jgi:nitronate monooxygenase
LEAGAAGVQVGTAFAYCNESGLDQEIRRRVLELSRAGQLDVKTDPLASPTGFPFKVLDLADSMSQEEVYQQRQRVCDLGYLRHAYKTADGTVGWRCGSEPVEAYLRKGGDLQDTEGRKCICNGLTSNIGLAQYRRQGGAEKPLVTSGDEVRDVARFLPSPDADGYSAEDVVAYLLSAVETGTVVTR